MNRLIRVGFAAILLALVATIAGFSASIPASAQAADCSAAGAQSAADVAGASADFELLTQALDAASLTTVLDSDGSFTVFAPNDDAFVALAQDLGYDGADEAGAFTAIVAALTDLGGGDPIPTLDAILKHHVLGTTQTAAEVTAATTLTTLQGGMLTVSGFTLVDSAPAIADATIVGQDIVVCNGVLHFVNRVMLPIAVDPVVAPEPTPTPTPTVTPTPAPTVTPVTPVTDEVTPERLEQPGDFGNAPRLDADGAFGFGIVATAGDASTAVPAAGGQTGGTGGGDASTGLAVTGSSSEAAFAVAVGLFALGASFVVSGRRRVR